MIDFIVSYDFLKPLLRLLKTVCFIILVLAVGLIARVGTLNFDCICGIVKLLTFARFLEDFTS